MKRFFLLLIGSIGLVSVWACQEPTTHGVISVNTCYDYLGTWSTDNIGIGCKAGVEEHLRFFTFYAVGNYFPVVTEGSVGGELAVNPLGIIHGHDTPINFSLFVGGGYKSYVPDKWYARVGLELSGRLGMIVSPYLSCSCDLNGGNPFPSANMQAGIRIWIGQDW